MKRSEMVQKLIQVLEKSSINRSELVSLADEVLRTVEEDMKPPYNSVSRGDYRGTPFEHSHSGESNEWEPEWDREDLNRLRSEYFKSLIEKET